MADASSGSTRSADSDEALLAAHLAGDRAAFPELIDRHHRHLYNAALSVLHHHQDAEDALQEAMIRALHYASSFRGDCPVRAWLYRIAVNTAITHLSRVQRAAVPTETDDAYMPDPVGLEEIDDVDTRMVLETALRTLSAAQRETFLLFQAGYTASEVAAMLGVPENTVRSRRHRARDALGKILMSELGRLRDT